MGVSKSCHLLLLLLLLTVSLRPRSLAEARTLQFQPKKDESKIFATLGVVCKCCDGKGEGDCTTSWKGSCHKLQCLPWKNDDLLPKTKNLIDH